MDKRSAHVQQWVYGFGLGTDEGNASMSALLGGKGANLAEMSGLGIPVPPGFTITTAVCSAFYEADRTFPEGLAAQVDAALKKVGSKAGMVFGDTQRPLLVSVRSGARASMPGMMDTVLNLGLNDETVRGLATMSGDGRFAYDSYRRFIQMYANVVLDLDHHVFEEILETCKEQNGFYLDTELSEENWKEVILLYKKKVEEVYGRPFPQDPHEQLWGAIGAVFGSWQNDRAKTYRRLHKIPESWGTAVNIQAMVFGNMGNTSATGVAFTRNPSTGENSYYGEFLVNAQGEDVVAGIRTPRPLSAGKGGQAGTLSMEEEMPDAYRALTDIFGRLERHYRDMQDIEFTVQENRLWILQTRSGKRTAKAALAIVTDMCREGLVSREEAVLRIDPASLDQLLHPSLDRNAARDVILTGLPASPGAATGEVVFSPDEAERLSREGRDVILVRTETSPEDIHGMYAARAIVTARGGMTSHAAVVARGMGRPCICGADSLKIDPEGGFFTAGTRRIEKGDTVTVDGAEGKLFYGAVKLVRPELSGDFETFMEWADSLRRMKVRTNADTPADAETARNFGAEGIGLCRTEHMFFEPGRIIAMREMILAGDRQGRTAALEKLLPMQRSDFSGIFRTMKGMPVTIRLLDPPLHEFIPRSASEIEDVAVSSGVDAAQLKARADSLHEFNPMLGHRGCRLGISFPEIYEMQTRAILEAACDVADSTGAECLPEIMIPLISDRKELSFLKDRIDATAKKVLAEKNRTIRYLVGTMIELPRAALMAGSIAEEAEFFSFGTNDLTQTVFGLSRDDSSSFLPEYMERGIFDCDPFVTIDEHGVGALITMAVSKGRKTRREIKLGICGEHGGDPDSVRLMEKAGLDYVSCSPYRIPVARLAAAQAAIREGKKSL